MKIYFIQHAPTLYNLTENIVSKHEIIDIIKEKPIEWEDEIGKYIPLNVRKYIISSPAARCIQTSELLFNEAIDC